MVDNPFGPFDRGGGETIKCPFCSEPDFDAVGLKIHFERGYCDVYNEIDTSLPEHLRDPMAVIERGRKLLETWPEQSTAPETSGGICARMPDKIEEKSCLYGGDKHCPYFKPGHPCCDCGATANRGVAK